MTTVPINVVSSRRVDVPAQAPTPDADRAPAPSLGVVARTGAVVAKGAGKGAATVGRRAWNVARGIATAPGEFHDWALATEYDPLIRALTDSGDTVKAAVLVKEQIAEQKERRARVKGWARVVLGWCPPFLLGGWAVGTVLFAALALVAIKMASGKKVVTNGVAKVKPGILSTAKAERALLWAGISAALTAVDGVLVAALAGGSFGDVLRALLVWHRLFTVYAAVPLALALIYALRWGYNATKDDGTIADDMRDGQVPVAATVHDDRRKNPPVVEAVLATKKLPEGTEPILVPPGVMPGNGGMIWTATIDTLGPSATVLMEPKARAELASRLGLSTQRMIATVDEDYGSRLHITGIVGKPWRSAPSPLVSGGPVDLWQGIPWGPTVEGDVVTYQVFERNALFGGESGAGKSTAMAGIWTAFALSPSSDIYVVDGGDVDTRPLSDSGLATAWTTELPEGIRVLTAVRDEVNRRQKLLGDSKVRKASPEWFAEHGLGFALLLIDEVARFTQRKGPEAEVFSDLMREIVQNCRKVGIHTMLSTQSPSVDAIDADARDVLPVRWLGRARSVDLGNKVMGKGAVGRGVSVSTLPNTEDTRGVGWYSAPGREIQMRPFDWTDAALAEVCRRGVELRRGSQNLSAADDDKLLAIRVADMVRERGVTVPEGRVMLARDVATALEVDQSVLRLALGRLGIATQKVSRPDLVSAHRHAHYVLSDLPVSRAI